MATLQQIAQTKSHHQAYQQDTEITILTQDNTIGPHLGITIKIGTITVTIETGIGLAGQDPIHTVIATGVPVKVPHKEVILGPITNPHATAYHATETQVHITTNETPHTEGPHLTEVFPGIAVGLLQDAHTTHHSQIKYSRWLANVSNRDNSTTSKNY